MRLTIVQEGSLLPVLMDREITLGEFAAINAILNRHDSSAAIAAQARAEYEAMSPDEQAKVKASWEARSEQERQDIRDEVELDLL